MALVSMKTQPTGMVESSGPNPYGYGLSICLNEDQVEALGLNKNPPAAGSQVGITAVAIVRSVKQESDIGEPPEDGEPADEIDVVLELQITDMAVSQGARGDTADKLYGG